ncbi:M23 family metallopeptidase [Parazoarcus communis]|uniref:M23ase beta-sheet core domain-containing protein n=1 Tax=Parazoarcus communis SWub3 = DSM 12120 TaxID=1121029 RepID=A0A323UNP0_9RHOO|nr:M23 family metallopeptidase [Parazoarcus communis]NMG72937.1 peptidoglycan DD-metalloendopeptidase family protein [Parazoarcus communis SWub3 = DSM 12120]PZA14245.1 hypothetical protein DNK49_22905 [Azoarcus communis] [Parazoarcus communis SWub3 = DSM 12120]
MTDFAWPLQSNRIRRDMLNHTFGMVRNGGSRPHQGWDLTAAPMTSCYAIADGEIAFTNDQGDYGKVVVLKFDTSRETLWAAYCHLTFWVVKERDRVSRGDLLGYTGNSGNARSMIGEDQHLHFEIRTVDRPGRGLTGRIDPKDLYGHVPIGWAIFEAVGDKTAPRGVGLKVRGVNVRG